MAAQQSLSGFKMTLHVLAHLQYDDIECRRALRAFVEHNTTEPYDMSSSTLTLSGGPAQRQGKSPISHCVEFAKICSYLKMFTKYCTYVPFLIWERGQNQAQYLLQEKPWP